MSTADTKTSDILQNIQRILDDGRTAVLVTLVDGEQAVGAKVLIEQSGEVVGSLGEERLDAAVSAQAKTFLQSKDDARLVSVKEFAPQLADVSDVRVLFERIYSEPAIVICGAGHVGASLAKLAAQLNYRVTLIDDRAEFLTSEQFPEPNISRVVATDWSRELHAAIGNGRGVSVAVVTRGHNEDEHCLQTIVTTSPDYVGLIGSKRRTRIVLDRLRESGADEEIIQRVHAPIGLDIGAVTPEEVALAILAEIVAERRGGRGGSLSQKI
jgi:xanthine dehydrogenase accessory factor